MMAEFYLTLPSDSSKEYFPDNTVTEFKVKLPKVIELQGMYEVGLAEISYPNNWNNIPAADAHLRIGATGIAGAYTNIKFKKLFFEGNPNALRKLLNSVSERGYSFSYNKDTHKMAIKLTRPLVEVQILSKPLCEILGFDQCTFSAGNNLDQLPKRIEASHEVDLDAGLHSIFVYTDLVEHTVIGDTLAPILRIVKVAGKHGRQSTATYNAPLYQPVKTNRFDVVTIKMASQTGEPILFNRGQAIVTLHFRPRRRRLLP